MAEDPHRRRVAVELNAFHWSGLLGDALEGATIGMPTVVHDLNGEPLFERVPLTGPGVDGFADVALHPAMATILMTVSPETPWHESDLVAEAREAAGGLPAAAPYRFVAYSHPKLAIEFLVGDAENRMLELWSWQEVPPARLDRPPSERPSQFERWSYLDELPDDHRARRQATHRRRVEANEAVPLRQTLNTEQISRVQFAPIVEQFAADSGGNGPGPVAAALGDQRDIHYSVATASHSVCYEKAVQETTTWCVPASIRMLLQFYRYDYVQDRIASDLNLGTKASPSATGLLEADWGQAATEIQSLTSNALQATKTDLDLANPDAAWSLFRTEILANRPAISFMANHSRPVTGYFDANVVALGYRGLRIYDPLAPSSGASLEAIEYAGYDCAITAQLQQV